MEMFYSTPPYLTLGNCKTLKLSKTPEPGAYIQVQERVGIVTHAEGEYVYYWIPGVGGQHSLRESFIAPKTAPKFAFEGLLPVMALPPHVGKTGTDPEIFAVDSSGTVVPSWKFVGEKPPSPSLRYLEPDIYTDGFQAEFAPPAQSCHEFLLRNVWYGLRELSKALPANTALQAVDVVEIPAELLQSAPDHHIAFGCSPSCNAYGPEAYEPFFPEDPRAWPLRYSGCHLHFSSKTLLSQIPAGHPQNCIKVLDKILGVAMTAMGRGLEDPRRRAAYGRPGEYRIPAPDRVEYRTPGSLLLRHPILFNIAADLGRTAFTLGLFRDEASLGLPDPRTLIEQCDADHAVSVLKSHSDFFKLCLQRSYPGNYESVWQLLLDGAAKHLPVYDSIASTWQFGWSEGPTTTYPSDWFARSLRCLA